MKRAAHIYWTYWVILLAAFNPSMIFDTEASGSPPAIVFEVNGDRVVIEQEDIVNAVAEFNENSHVIFCLTAPKAREFKEGVERNLGKKASFEIAGEIYEKITLNSFRENCNVVGPFRRIIAEHVAEFFRGETVSLALDEFNPMESNQYCPEKLFIEICMNTTADLDAVKKLAEKKRLELDYAYEGERTRSINILFKDLTEILVVERRVVDLVSSSCTVFDLSSQQDEAKSVCAINFPLVQQGMPDKGKRIEYLAPSYDGSRREYSQQWTFEKENNRSLVSATIDELGHSARYTLEKLVLPVRK